MTSPRDPFVLRLCLLTFRLFSAIVPRVWRADWRAEWEAEVRCRWDRLAADQHLDWRTRMDLLRRASGAFPDAAWLRRQFTTDAEALQDLRHGARMLRKSPVFAVSAVLILALGIGGAVCIVTLLDTLLFRTLPYAEADRVVTIWTQHAARPGEPEDVAPADFLDWRERSRAFSTVAAAVPYSYDYTGGDRPEVFFGARVTEGFWEAIGVEPIMGRAFRPDEHVPGAGRPVIISHGLWQQRFEAAPDIVGRSISLDGEPWTVVGVLPRSFAPQLLPRPGELGVWTPKIVQEHERRTRGSAWWNVVARLAPGVTIAQAQSELDAISSALGREHPRTNAASRALVVSMRDHLMGDVRMPLFVMLGAVVLVLAIGCANVASLLLARGMDRERELSIRAALGAGRLRLVRQLLVESLLLSSVAAVTGVAIAHWAVGIIVAIAPSAVLRLHEATVDGRILLFAAGLATLTTVAFGLLPALQLSRPGRGVVRERHATGSRRAVRQVLVVAEVALALVLLTGAGLLIRSFARLMAVDPGFTASNVVTVQVFAYSPDMTVERLRSFFNTTLDHLAVLPGVHAAGAVSAMPFATANIDIKSPLEIVGRGVAAEGDRRGVYVTIASPGFFPAMRIPLREGRFLDASDHDRAPIVAVISEALGRRDWPSESPLGRRVRIQWHGQPVEAEIVGVVSELRHDGLDRAPRPEVFLPLAQLPFGSMTFVLRGDGDPSALIEAGKREVWAVNPMQSIYEASSLESMLGASLVRQRFSVLLMSTFAFVALLLCATGIYGIISFTTAARTREIGVRMALGADGSAIQRMVLREGGSLIGAGLILGVAGAAGGGRIMQSLLFEVRPGDPLTVAAVCGLLAAVGLAACYLPARRATRVDPLVALRPE
jgi:putative ABC transport system permease protein